MNLRCIVLIAGSLLCVAPVLADNFTGKVIRVNTGDTITVLHDGQEKNVRLRNIDCPKTGQPHDEQAREYTTSLCLHQLVSVSTSAQDSGGELVAEVTLPDRTELSREILKAGWARCSRPDSSDPSWQGLENDAQSAHIGLWLDAGLEDDSRTPEPSNKPLVGGVEKRALKADLSGNATSAAAAVDLERESAKADSAKSLVGHVEDSSQRLLQARAERDGAAVPIDLTAQRPSSAAIMRIVQIKLNSNSTDISQTAATAPFQLGSNTAAQRTTPVQRPERAGLDDGQPPRRAGLEHSGPPVRLEEQRPQRGMQEDRPQIQIATLPDEPGGLAPGRPTRLSWIQQTPQRQTNGESASSAGRSMIVPQANVDVPEQEKQKKHHRPRKEPQEKAVPQELAPVVPTTPPLTPAREALLWDQWYARLNELVCRALTRTMAAHGNPSGKCRIHIDVSKNHHLKASIVLTSNQPFGEAIQSAYTSLDGSPSLEFPAGTERQAVEYESDHTQDISAPTAAFDAHTVHGDLEYIK